MSNDNARDNLVSGDIVKTMLSLSIPAILGMVVIGLYNFMDAVFVGRMVGPEAMTAVKVSYSFTLLNSGISTLIGTGSASLLSRAIGKKDQETVDKIMGNLIALVLVLSVIIMAVGLIFTKPLLMLSGAKGDILTEASRYLKVVFLGSLFVNFAQSSNMVIGGEGKLNIEIMYMVEGHAEFEMENRRVSSANKGDVCIFNSRIGAKKISFGKGGMRSVSIVLLIDTLKDELDRFFETKEFGNKPLFEYVLNSDSCICFAANEMLRTIFMEMVLLPEEYSVYHRKLLVIRAILSLLDMKTGKNTGYRYFSGDSSNKVHAARKILGENISIDISVEELAERVGLNRTTLQRVFKQMYGVTIFEYRTWVRMQESKNLLIDNELPITEIAGICGYSNASKFSAAFKKRFGLTPTEWKSKNVL